MGGVSEVSTEKVLRRVGDSRSDGYSEGILTDGELTDERSFEGESAKKIDDGHDEKLIQTVHGLGYRIGSHE